MRLLLLLSRRLSFPWWLCLGGVVVLWLLFCQQLQYWDQLPTTPNRFATTHHHHHHHTTTHDETTVMLGGGALLSGPTTASTDDDDVQLSVRVRAHQDILQYVVRQNGGYRPQQHRHEFPLPDV